jgi:hypothetical protein
MDVDINNKRKSISLENIIDNFNSLSGFHKKTTA